MHDITKKYSNGEVTILWKPNQCAHSGVCVGGLHQVFNASRRPWIIASNATTAEIIAQVKQCPSGALSYYLNHEENAMSEHQSPVVIEVTKNGPLIVQGTIAVKDAEGKLVQKENKTALCRCGGSANKPYCDGTHKRNGFEG